MINEKNKKGLENTSPEEKAIEVKIAYQYLYKQRLDIVDYINLCLEKNAIAKEINGVKIIHPIVYSLICLDCIKRICNFNLTDEEDDEIFNKTIGYDKEKYKTTKDKLDFYLYLISERAYDEYDNVNNIIENYCNNGCKFKSRFDSYFLLFSMSRIISIILFIGNQYPISFEEYDDYIKKTYKEFYEKGI